ncbi:hypothetical protein QYF36_005073 [Acer negundo]|nr:hypothetical protein QYF36_005073 [Acer negundo]
MVHSSLPRVSSEFPGAFLFSTLPALSPFLPSDLQGTWVFYFQIGLPNSHYMRIGVWISHFCLSSGYRLVPPKRYLGIWFCGHGCLERYPLGDYPEANGFHIGYCLLLLDIPIDLLHSWILGQRPCIGWGDRCQIVVSWFPSMPLNSLGIGEGLVFLWIGINLRESESHLEKLLGKTRLFCIWLGRLFPTDGAKSVN